MLWERGGPLFGHLVYEQFPRGRAAGTAVAQISLTSVISASDEVNLLLTKVMPCMSDLVSL